MVDTMIAFELASPEKLLISQAVQMVVVPGDQGDFGVLAGHARMISSMRSGTICIYTEGVIRTRIFVSGGFVEVTPERCIVLAQDAVPLDQIDRAQVERTIEDRVQDVSTASSETERDTAERRLGIARTMLEAVTRPAYQ